MADDLFQLEADTAFDELDLDKVKRAEPKPLFDMGTGPTAEELKAFNPAAAIFAAPEQTFVPATAPEAVKKSGTSEPLVDAQTMRPIPERERPEPIISSWKARQNAELAQIRAWLNDPVAIAMASRSIKRGNRMTGDNSVIQDYLKMDANKFEQLYGTEARNNLDSLTIGGDAVAGKARQSTNTVDYLRDVGVNAVAGATDILGSVSGFMVNANPVSQIIDKAAQYGVPGAEYADNLLDQAGVNIVKGTRALSDWEKTWRSQQDKEQEYVDSIDTMVDEIDLQRNYEENKIKGGQIYADLHMYGEDFGHGAKRFVSNPATATRMTANAIGSYGALGPVMRLVGAGATAAKALPYGERTAAALNAMRFELAVGTMEGGGAYMDTVERVVNTPNEVLLDRSPTYRKLRLEGKSEDEAKAEMAIAGAVPAGEIAAIVGVVTSAAAHTKGVETGGALFSPTKLPANIAKEVFEETPQSFSGQLAGNVGEIASGSDPNKGIMEGTGAATAQGALAAAGSPVATGAPGAALKTTAAVALAPIKVVANALNARGEKIRAAQESGSTISPETLAADNIAAAETAPSMAAGLRTLAQESQANTDPTKIAETATEAETFIKNVEQASIFSGSDLKGLTKNLVGKIQEFDEKVDRTPTTFEVFNLMAQTASDENASEADRIAAGTFLLDRIERNKQLFGEDTPAFLDQVDQTRPERVAYDNYRTVLNAIEQSPKVKEAMDWARTKMGMSDQEITPDKPVDRETVDNVIQMAKHTPDRINPKVVQGILHQADEKLIDITPEERQQMRGALAQKVAGRVSEARSRLAEPGLAETEVTELENQLKAFESGDLTALETKAEAKAETQAKTKEGTQEGAKTTGTKSGTEAEPEAGTAEPKLSGTDFVNRQIHDEGGPNAHQKSISTHTSEINKAIAGGNKPKIKTAIQSLVNFAQSQVNKVGALNQSIENQRTNSKATANVVYEAVNKFGKFYSNTKGQGVVVGSPGSERNAKTIHGEAMALAQLANHWSTQFPDLGIKSIEVPDLNLPSGKVGGSSTTAAQSQSQSLPVTVTETGDKATSELPPAGTSETQTTTEAQPVSETVPETKSRINPEELQDKTKWTDEDITDEIRAIDQRFDQGIQTEDDAATQDALQREWDRRYFPEDIQEQTISESTSESIPESLTQTLDPNSDRETVDQFNSSATDQDIINAHQNAENNRLTIGEFKGKAKTLIQDILSGLSKTAGFDITKLARMIAPVTWIEGGPKGGMFSFAGPSVLLNQERIDEFNRGEIPASVISHLLGHELSHAIDFHSIPSGSKAIYGSSARKLFNKSGTLWKEFLNLKGKVPDISQEPLWDYLDQQTEEVFPNEFFAELGTFILNNPTLARELIPRGVRVFESFLQQAATSQQLGKAKLGDTISESGRIFSEESQQQSTEQKPVTEPENKLTDREITDLLDTVDIEDAPTEINLKEAFPKLVQPTERNFFHEAFRLAKEVKSRLTYLAHPIRGLIDAIDTGKKLKAFLKGAEINGYDVNTQARDNFTKILNLGLQIRTIMNQALDAKLASQFQGKSVTDGLKEGTNEKLIRSRDMRIFNLVEQIGNKFAFNDQLIESAIIGALDWIMNAGSRTQEMDLSDVADFMGISEEEARSYLTQFKHGITLDRAVQDLTRQIKKFWGLDTNPNARDDFTKGIPEAVAKEILVAMTKLGLVRRGSIVHTRAEPVLDDAGNPVMDPDTNEVMLRQVKLKDYQRIWFDQRPKPLQDLIDSLDATSELLSDIALIDKEIEAYSVGIPITDDVDKRQLRNPDVATTAQNKRALQTAESTGYFPDMVQYNFMKAIGLEGYVTLMSGRPYVEGDLSKTHVEMNMNINDWESLKGQQRTLRASFRNITKQMAQVEAYAAKHGTPVDQVPIYYKHHINRLGRPQMDGASNPQTDKTARHILVPFKATIDLSNNNTQDFHNFFLTVAQGIGLKMDKAYGADRVQEAVAATVHEGGTYYSLVQALKHWLKTDQETVPDEIQKMILDLGLDNHGQHAVISVARYLAAQESNQDDLSKFETSNPFEEDGKTNGVANSLMMNASGPFSVSWFQMIGKAGIYPGNFIDENGNPKTLNQHVAEVDDADIYQAVSNETASNHANIGRSLTRQAVSPNKQDARNGKAVLDHYQAFRRLLAALSGDVELDKEGNLTISRGLSKSPQTKSVYGAGLKAISTTLAGDLVRVLYEKMSEYLRTNKLPGNLLYGEGNDAQFQADLRALLSNIAIRKRDGTYFLKHVPTRVNLDAQEFTIQGSQFETFRRNVQTFLGQPMQSAIDELVNKHVENVTSAIQRATQLQSVFLKALFVHNYVTQLAVEKANPEEHDYGQGESLSETQQRNIRKDLKKFSPFITTGNQNYMLSGGETTELFDKTTLQVGNQTVTVDVSSGYSGTITPDTKMTTSAYVYGPLLVGVKVIPTLNVGSGDGQMMNTHLSDNPETAKRNLHVFDGLYVPADRIQDDSKLINHSVFQTYTSDPNPIRAVAESFAIFAQSDPVSELFPNNSDSFDNLNQQQMDALYEITKVGEEQQFPSRNLLYTPSKTRALIKSLLRTLNHLATDTDIRRQVYGEFGMTVDQMAGAMTPHVNPGTFQVIPNISLNDLADVMTDRYNQIWEQKKAEAQQEHAIQMALSEPFVIEHEANAKPNRNPYPQKSQKSVTVEAITSKGTLDLASGATVLNADNVQGLVNVITREGQQRSLVQDLINALSKDYKIVFGTAEELDTWEQNNNSERFIPDSNNKYGKIDTVSKVILISNIAPETIIHELVHAATFDKVKGYYGSSGSRNSLSQTDRNAIENIAGTPGSEMPGGLMGEWLSLDLSNESNAVVEADASSRASILNHWRAGRKAEAVSEFMAWVLANQNLARVASRTKVSSVLLKIFNSTLQALKKMLFGSKINEKNTHFIFENLRFNTQVLARTPTPVELMQNDASQVMLYQSSAFGTNDRLQVLRQWINNKILAYLDYSHPDALEQHRVRLGRELEVDDAYRSSERVTRTFAAHFDQINHNMQAWSTFYMVQAGLMTDIRLDNKALGRIEELYDHVIKTLKWEDFRTNDDPNDQADKTKAQEKYNVLNGAYIIETDKFGRSSLMSSFLALAMSDDSFRDILKNMPKPESLKSDTRTFDTILDDLGTAGMDQLSIYLSGEKGSTKNIIDALDNLTVKMVETVQDQRSFIELKTEGGIDSVDRYISTNIQNLADKVERKAGQVAQSPLGQRSRVIKLGALATQFGAMAISDSGARALAQGTTSALARTNKERIPLIREMRALANDLIGRHEGNKNTFDMITPVRTKAEQTRQRYREEIPVDLAKKFSRVLDPKEWTSLFKGIGRVDLAAAGKFEDAFELFGDTQRRRSEIASLEASVSQTEGTQRAARIFTKGKQLANYMNTQDHGVNILTNAWAVSQLFNETGYAPNPNVSRETVDKIDKLITLYAIDGLSQEVRDQVSGLVQSEEAGMKSLFNYIASLRKTETEKAHSTNVARNNYYKGHIPSLRENEGGDIKIIDDIYESYYQLIGYTRVGDYNGSSADHTARRRSYYSSPVNGQAPYRQGIAQTIHQTAGGVDPDTGFSVGTITAGRIEDGNIIQQINRRIHNSRATSENLVPRFNELGEVIAYERAADPAKLTILNNDTNLARMAGVWKGRQVEESFAQEINRALVDEQFRRWQEAVTNRTTNEFENVLTTSDRVLADTVDLLPRDMRAYIEQVFGRGTYMVHRASELDELGTRQASVGDLFTGNSRWNQELSRRFQNISLGLFSLPPFTRFFGDNAAYNTMIKTERFIQEMVSNAKFMIVVKSVVVPAMNNMANMWQLVNRGVPFRDILGKYPTKISEINTYIKREQLRVSLEVDLETARGENNIQRIRTLETRIQSLNDSYKRMSIWPLIQAGEFASISGNNVTAEDLALSDGKWGKFMDKLINAIPDNGLRTTARYGLITKDTAIAKALSRAVQYGDFIAKAVLYDHQISKGMTDRQAIAMINEAFINYNRLSGRGRHALESVGLMWFYNFKLRSVKEAAYLLRNKPFRSILMMLVPWANAAGSPIADNVVSLGLGGDLGWSLGPEMGLNSWTLHPLESVLN